MKRLKNKKWKNRGSFLGKGQIRFVIREEVQWGFMNCRMCCILWTALRSASAAYGDVSVGYREAAWYNAWRYERRLWKLRKQYPHLSIEECEYSCAGAEFYMKLLKHQGFMIHASAVEKEGKAYLFSAPSGTGKSSMRSFGGRRSKENRFGSLTMTSPQFVCKTAYFMHAGLRSAGKPIKWESQSADTRTLYAA